MLLAYALATLLIGLAFGILNWLELLSADNVIAFRWYLVVLGPLLCMAIDPIGLLDLFLILTAVVLIPAILLSFSKRGISLSLASLLLMLTWLGTGYVASAWVY